MTHRKAVLLDTSFFLRFLNESDSLFKNADNYFRYFLQYDIDMLISTISIAEYCVGGNIHELPLKNLQLVPFNLNHAQRTGTIAKVAFQARKSGTLHVRERNLIPNDTKLFAQADCEKSVAFYLSSDTESLKIYNLLHEVTPLHFQFLDLNVPHTQVFGLIDFGA